LFVIIVQHSTERIYVLVRAGEWCSMVCGMVDRGLPLTFYEQVAASLRERIAAGEWRDGPLASIRNLQEEYGVGKDTIMRAIKILADEDLVVTIDKRGTYVKRDT
jgi:GntR family transcriptional regulator